MSRDWKNYQSLTWCDPEGALSVDLSDVQGVEEWLGNSESLFSKGSSELKAIIRGDKINSDEDRMVGHYWLRDPERAPSEDIKKEIVSELSHIKDFGKKAKDFKYLLQIGIGGSALGPQLLADALRFHDQPLQFFSLDNTDPDGVWTTLNEIPALDKTLVLVVSKSGGTKETRNGMILTEKVFSESGLDFSKHAVAITGEGSRLFDYAKENNWLDIFPMWDWVGGRTSLWSTVGLLPATLLGIDIDSFLSGAMRGDEFSEQDSLKENPAAMLALCWYKLSGTKDMVVLPYKDRLLYLSRYLQQLVMESLGKELDRSGNTVEQGLTVYGNKGSTDQHAYVQQLRDGLHNFFALFIEVQRDFPKDLKEAPISSNLFTEDIDGEATAGDYLHGFYLGTREALSEKGRSSISITVPELSPYTLGMLISLFENAVSFYAAYADINAYHQPGVEAGKKAAERVIALQDQIISFLKNEEDSYQIEEIANALKSDQSVHIYKILERQVALGKVTKVQGETPFLGKYSSQ